MLARSRLATAPVSSSASITTRPSVRCRPPANLSSVETSAFRQHGLTTGTRLSSSFTTPVIAIRVIPYCTCPGGPPPRTPPSPPGGARPPSPPRPRPRGHAPLFQSLVLPHAGHRHSRHSLLYLSGGTTPRNPPITGGLPAPPYPPGGPAGTLSWKMLAYVSASSLGS